MPLYEFRCLKCNKTFELLVKNKKEFIMPLHFSDTCNAEVTERAVSPSNFQLKSDCSYNNGYIKRLHKICLQDEMNDLRLTLDSTKKKLIDDANKDES